MKPCADNNPLVLIELEDCYLLTDFHYYEKHKKFFCGIVLDINGFNYFAPVSSYNQKRHTTFLIMDKDRQSGTLKAISSLRFSFMFPCPIKYLKIKDFSKEEIKYRILLRIELQYCNANVEKICMQYIESRNKK